MSENKKPRIAEILGVEVGERFSVEGQRGGNPLYVDGDGWVRYVSDGTISTSAVTIAINHPERIIRKTRWTEQEIKKAKAIKVLWPDAEDIRARDGVTGEVEYRVCAGCMVFGVIYNGYFPTIKCGENYTLDEIIGGAE